jgi:hypothetical protein
MWDNVPVIERIQLIIKTHKTNLKVLFYTRQSLLPRPRLVDVALCTAVFMAVVFCNPLQASADDSEHPEKTILLINPADMLSRSAQISDQGMFKVFAESEQHTNILSEHLHLDTDSVLEHDALAFIQKKYHGKHVDLIIARGEEVLDFLEHHGKRLWPNVPVLYFSISDTSQYWQKPPPGKSGVFMAHNYADNLALIKKTQPTLRRLIQITENNDKQGSARLQDELETINRNSSTRPDLIIERMPAMTPRARLKYVSELPADTALLALTLNSDNDDLFYSATNTIRNLSNAASVPIYGMRENFIGNGAVGGYVVDLAEHGAQTATLALQILAHPE